MHPVANIRGAASSHLAGRRIVLAVSGSIAAVKTVELARELVRHGADVTAVMSRAATKIIHPNALEFATGNPVVTRLTGNVEHVALLGDVPEQADLLLVAPATANTVGKMAWGIDDTSVTTCATVAFGTGVPVVVAPAMHDAMMHHPKVQQNVRTLIDELGVTWVEPKVEEKKAKLAEVEAIVDAVIHRLSIRADGPLAGARALVIGGATGEPIDAVRILTNRSSGRTASILAQELYRAGATVTLWLGNSYHPVAEHIDTVRFQTHAELMALVEENDMTAFDSVWMPAAIGDYAAVVEAGKIPSGRDDLTVPLKPLPKVIEAVREAAPDTLLVAFKAEADEEGLVERAKSRIKRYGAQYAVANTAAAFGAEATCVHLVGADGSVETIEGSKEDVLREVVAHISRGGVADVKVKP